MAKKLLIIDNEDLTETKEQLEGLAKKEGFAIEVSTFHIGLPDGNSVVNDQGIIDLNLVKEKFLKEFGFKKFQMVASDFRLGDDITDGMHIINFFNGLPNTKNAQKILYSSEIDEVIQQYLDDYKDERADYDETWKKFKILFKLKIVDFSKREDIEIKIVSYLKKNTDQADDFIIEFLLENGGLKFLPIFEIYEDLDLKSIAEKITSADSQSLKFKRKLIELGIAGLLKLDDE